MRLFDTVELYKSLLTGNTFGDDKHFSKAYIPLNARSGLENKDYSINENGVPCCPHDPSLAYETRGAVNQTYEAVYQRLSLSVQK